MVGYFGKDCFKRVYLVIITFIQLVEIGYTRTDKEKIKMLLFELLVSGYLGTLAGELIKNKVKMTIAKIKSFFIICIFL